MTTMAAPSEWISFACERKTTSPSFREIEFTMHLPCALLRPERIVSQSEESIIRAAFATEGSFCMWRTNFSISTFESRRASSMLMSIIEAPFSIWSAATWRAWSYSPEAMRRANFLDPATFVLSPILQKLPSLRSTFTLSSPLTLKGLSPSCEGMDLGGTSLTAVASAQIWSGVVPQHPPTMFTVPFSAILRMQEAMWLGLSS